MLPKEGSAPLTPPKSPSVVKVCAWAHTARLKVRARTAKARTAKARTDGKCRFLSCMRTSVGVAKLLSQEFQLSASVRQSGLTAASDLGAFNLLQAWIAVKNKR